MPNASRPSSRFVPVNAPLLSERSKELVRQCLDTGWLSSAGPFVEQFEREFAAYVGVKHGVAVCNGTAALHVALWAAGVREGDEVIVPAFTMIGSIFAIIHAGAHPIFVDAEPDGFNLDVAQLERLVTPRTRAIMPVHLFGHPCDMAAVRAFAQAHDLKVIEDAAEAHGATFEGRRAGGLGHVGCFSFYANKILTTGEGGMLVTDDAELAARAKAFRDLCHSPERRFIHTEVGYNYRITNIQAAIGVGELGSIDSYLAKKRHMAAAYAAGLSAVPGLTLPSTKPNVENVFWMYAVLVDEARFGMSKDAFRAALKARGIDTRDMFYPPSEQPALTKRYGELGPFPNTDRLARTGCYLPSGLALTDDELAYVVAQVRDLTQAARP
jgi:perosamine synthetase